MLATLDESTYAAGDGAMGADHPIAWAHEYDGGARGTRAAGTPPRRTPSRSSARTCSAGSSTRRAGAEVRLGRDPVRSRRATVDVRVDRLPALRGPGSRAAAGRWRARPACESGGLRATTGALPRGRWRLEVALTDGATGLTTTSARTVSVR